MNRQWLLVLGLTLTPAGQGYAVVQRLIVGAHPRGCSVSGAHYTCRYRLANGKSMLALMGLVAEQGTELVIEATGSGAAEAIQALLLVLQRTFDEE